MNESERVSAGEAFKRELETNPDARAGWERARLRLKLFGELMSKAEESIREDREAALQELGNAIRDAMQQTGRELEAVGFEPPRTIEDWQHLAHLVEMPFETIRKGNFTAADVYAVAMAWVDRQKLKAKLQTKATSSMPMPGMPIDEVIRRAEAHVKAHKGVFPGRNKLAEIIGCAPASITKAVKNSSYLKARKAEHDATKKSGREVQVSDSMDAFTDESDGDQDDRDAALDRLIAEQEAERKREERQHRSAKQRPPRRVDDRD